MGDNKHNKGRTMTLRVKIIDPDVANVLWDSLMGRELMAGCSVLGVTDDDLFADIDRLEKRVAELEERLGITDE